MKHKTPSEEIFNEMKQEAIRIWQTYDNQYGYVDEKMERINSITNFKDNAMVFFRMFDNQNQFKMQQHLSPESLFYISNNL